MLIGVALAACVVAALGIFTVGIRQVAALDFVALHAAARLVATGHGREILDPDAILAAERAVAPERLALLPYVHPPAVALLLAPLGSMPLEAAYGVMVVLTVASLVLAVLLLRPLAQREWRPVLLALALVAPPSLLAVAQGQTSPFVLLATAASLRAPPQLSGALLGLAWLRPQTAPLYALIALSDRGRAAGFAVSVALLAVASAAVVGLDGLLRYVVVLFTAGTWSFSGRFGLTQAVGWTGPALALGVPEVGVILTLLSLGVGALLVVRAPELGARLAVASPWSLLASPHALLHDGVLAYIAVAARIRRVDGIALWAGSGVLVGLLQLAGVPVVALWLVVLALTLRRQT